MQRDQKPARLHFLDGIRGWAAIVVVLYHVFCDGFPLSEAVSNYLRLFPPFNAMIAVYLFFIVSGFALSVPYLATSSNRMIYRTALGRYFRLAIPILAACLLVHLTMRFNLLLPVEQRPVLFRGYLLFQSDLAHLLYFSLIGVFWHYDDAVSYIAPLWTMSIELAGGFLVLGLLALAGGNRYRWPIYAAAAAYALYLQSYYFLFIAGLILADIYYSFGFRKLDRVGWILLSIGVAAPFALSWTVSALTMLASVSIFISFLLLVRAKEFFSTPLSGFFGYISFPLYLLHGPVMSVVGLPLMLRFGDNQFGALLVRLIIVLASFLLAWLFSPVNDFAVLVARLVGTRGVGWTDRLRLVVSSSGNSDSAGSGR